MEISIPFILLHISIIFVFFVLILIIRMKNKKQIHFLFLYTFAALIIWSTGMLFETYAQYIFDYSGMIFAKYYLISISFVPVLLLLIGLEFAYSGRKISKKFYYLFIIPIITTIIIWTNDFHHLFFIRFALANNSNQIIFGRYFLFHTIFSYLCDFSGLYILVYYSIKNSGFFSRQSILIAIGSIVPLIIDVIYDTGIFDFPTYVIPMSFSFAAVCIMLAIFKFDFLNIVPIALQRIVDLISDSFIVIDEEYNIIDFNKTFVDTFSQALHFKRKDNIISILKENGSVNIDSAIFVNYLNKSVLEKESLLFEKQIVCNNFNKYFSVEIIPVFSENQKKVSNKARKLLKLEEKPNLIGIIILLKDITEHKKNLQALKEQQEILLEQERLASLGQLIGGIAHNLKTPIMSISGGIEALKDLTFEYRDSIDDKSVTEQDHKEIAKEMLSWLDRIKPYCSYMSDVISAVKGQAVQMNASITVKFTVDELVKRVDLLMKHELKKYLCILNVESNIDMSTEIKGEVNNLVQVFDNIIINAMQAYEGQNGTIDLKIIRSGDNVEFTFRDYGRGIPKNVTDRLFKEMVTTKGKNGTGLGLYMSYSTIKGRFGGNMSFTSKVGCGTTFFISIPCITYGNQEAG